MTNSLETTSVQRWPTLRTDSSTSSITTYESENKLERTNTTDIQALRGMVSMFSQRIGNLELDAASTNMKMHELQKTSQVKLKTATSVRSEE
jgi:hypothetical protein